MSATVRPRRRPVGPDLAIAGAWMIFSAFGVGSIALISEQGQSPSLNAGSVLPLIVGAFQAVSGVEIFRRRHFLVAVVPPASMVLFSLAYGIASGHPELVIFSVAVLGFVSAAVFSRRSDFIG